MVWLIGLLLVLLIAILILLILPPAEWQAIFRRLAQGDRVSKLMDLLRRQAAAVRGRLREWMRQWGQGKCGRPAARPRRWREEAQAESTASSSWQERRGRPALQRMVEKPREEEALPAETPPHRASQPALSRSALIIAVLFIVVAVGISLWQLGMGAIVTGPPPRFTVLVAALQGSVEGQSSAELLAQLRQDFSAAGIPPTATLQAIADRPADADAAAALARAKRADLLLWGRVQPDLVPGYFLTLTVIPVHSQIMAREFAEYNALMMTPPHFPLNSSGKSGLTKEEVGRAVTWVTRFYSGHFDRLESLPPPEVQGITLYPPLFYFHWMSLLWFKGDYDGAVRAYDALGCLGELTPPGIPLPPRWAAERAICLAAVNNRAVALITRESLGQAHGSALDGAIILLSSVIQAAPDALTARYNLGRAYLARGRWNEAISTLDEVLSRDSRHAAAWAALSEACTEAGDLLRARDAAAQAMNLDSGLVAAYLAQGRYLLAIGHLPEAERALDQALQRAKAETTARRSQEAALREGPQANQKRADYMAAWARRNDAMLARIYLARARVYLRQGEIEGEPSIFLWVWRMIVGEPSPLEKADAEIKQALQVHPEWATALRIRAQMFMAKGDLENAVGLLRKLQEQDPRDLGAHLDLIGVLRRQWRDLRRAGRDEEAQQKLAEIRAQYQLLIDEDIAPAQGYFGLGDVAQENGEWDEARQAYLQAVAVDPAYAEAYLRLGLVELNADDEYLALDYFSQALQASGDKGAVAVSAHCERGDIFLEQYLWDKSRKARWEEARDEFEAARKQDGRAIRALNGLGRIAYEQGDIPAAEGYYRQAQAVDGGDFDMLYGLGRVYEARGQSDIAADYFRQAVGKRGNSIAAHYHLGVAYYALLDRTRAVQNLQWVQEACLHLDDAGRLKADDWEACGGVEAWLARISGEE